MLVKRITRIACLVLIQLTCLVIVLGSSNVQQSAFAATDWQFEGFGYAKVKNFSKALECFTKALKDHPQSWQLMQSVGNCQMELGHYDTAIANLQKSIEVGGLRASQCVSIAAVYQRMGDTKKSLNWLNLACSVDPAAAADPGLQAAIRKLEDPANSPSGFPTAPDYFSSLVSVSKWPKQTIPIKVYVQNS